MGKRKPFIDKKRSTTYNLVFQAAEDAAAAGNDEAGPSSSPSAAAAQPPAGLPGADRVLVAASRGVGIGRPDAEAVAAAAASRPPPRYPPHHPLAWLNDELGATGPSTLTPARRRELLDLGFPDDGYDYLKHLRDPAPARAVEMGEGVPGVEAGGADAAAAAAAAEQPAPSAGPSVFVPAPVAPARPAPDVRAFDASGLTIHRPARDDDDAAAAAGGVTVFARAVHRVRRQAAAEVAALDGAEAALAELFEGGVEVVEASAGRGDLQDDFVLLAADAGGAVVAGGGEEEEAEGDGGESSEGWTDPPSSAAGEPSEADESDAEGDEGDDAVPDLRTPGPPLPPVARRPGSIASTYWRPPRADRPPALSEIDDAFETLALEYDSDEIGSLGSDNDGEWSDDDGSGGDAAAQPRRRGAGGGVPQRDASEFADVFAEFLASQDRTGGQYVTPAQAAAAAAAAAEASGSGSVSAAMDAAEAAHAAAALAATRAALARAVAEAEAEAEAEEEGGAEGDGDGDGEDAPRRRSAVAARAAAAAAAEAASPPRERWDCETVLSLATTSATFRPGRLDDGGGARRRPSRPAVASATTTTTTTAVGPLEQIRLSAKTGLPLGTGVRPAAVAPPTPGPSAPAPLPPQRRSPGETPAERKARKAAVKAARADARVAKKETRVLFKEAAVKAAALAAVPAPSVVHIP